MSVLQQEVVDKVTKLSDDNLQFILDMINRFIYIKPQNRGNKQRGNKIKKDTKCIRKVRFL